MDISRLIGQMVQHSKTRQIGTVTDVRDGSVFVDFHGKENRLAYPGAFSGILLLEDEDLQNEIMNDAEDADFDGFKRQFRFCVQQEIDELKSSGGRRYTALNGTLVPNEGSVYIYVFDMDAELHLMDGTSLRLYRGGELIAFATSISCEEYTITIQTSNALTGSLEQISFSADSWQLLEALDERIAEMHADRESIAYAMACKGRYQVDLMKPMRLGQDAAVDHAMHESVTVIWGPPGTGKTYTLARIAKEYIDMDKRVLMLSYSNVSVDGAMLRVYNNVEEPDGKVIRYGYPRMDVILNSRTMTSYQYVLYKNPDVAQRYYDLIEERKDTRKKSARRAEIDKSLSRIRNSFKDQEAELIQSVPFVATTVSKALIDKAIYSQHFDMVIFDEASMAYIPQIVFAAGLATERFCCMGDFNQLPAIVQSNNNPRLEEDIFEYTGVTDAVERSCGHGWLVMLNMQWRMHPTIAEFVGRNMYQGLLRSGDDMLRRREEIAAQGPVINSPMDLIDLSGTYSVCCKTGDKSRINLLSAMISVMIAEQIAEQYEVGIITPYSAQSRLILSMVRDIRDHNPALNRISCATVHQFQGSERSVIIYDAVECFRMTYPGTLLTSKKHNTADRLFNVALTRTQGKFIMVANVDFFRRKRLSRTLLFAKAQDEIEQSRARVLGADLWGGWIQYTTSESSRSLFYIDDYDREWDRYIEDIRGAKDRIRIMIPGGMLDNEQYMAELVEALSETSDRGVDIHIVADENILLPEELETYAEYDRYAPVPVTMIDKEIVWYGQPSCDADFMTEGDIIPTKYQIYIRFKGMIAARSVAAFLKL